MMESCSGGAAKLAKPCKLGGSPARQSCGTTLCVVKFWVAVQGERVTTVGLPINGTNPEQPCKLGGSPARHSCGTTPREVTF